MKAASTILTSSITGENPLRDASISEAVRRVVGAMNSLASVTETDETHVLMDSPVGEGHCLTRIIGSPQEMELITELVAAYTAIFPLAANGRPADDAVRDRTELLLGSPLADWSDPRSSIGEARRAVASQATQLSLLHVLKPEPHTLGLLTLPGLVDMLVKKVMSSLESQEA